MPRHELRANVRHSDIPLSINFYRLLLILCHHLHFSSFYACGYGMIQCFSEGPLDSAPNVSFALGVYKCAC